MEPSFHYSVRETNSREPQYPRTGMDKQLCGSRTLALLRHAACLSFRDQGVRAKATSSSFLHSTETMPGAPLASLMGRDLLHDPVFGHQLDFGEDDKASISYFDCACDEDVDQDAFHAVFPQAPTLVKQHALRPVVDTLRVLIATPERLVATLLSDDEGAGLAPQSLSALEAKTHAYTQTHLGSAVSVEEWKRISSFAQRGAKHEERWTSPQLAHQVDEFMTKLAIHYASVWSYVSAIVIKHVHYVETTVAELAAQWCSDSSQDIGMVALMAARLPDQDSHLSLRPLRLRSQTKNAGLASQLPHLPPPRPLVTPTAPASTSTPDNGNGANQRVRLARQSNEFLIAWFLHHKSKPYPSGPERVQIAKKTGLSEQQVRNWFANMRKRHWKPKNEKKSKQPRCLLDMLLRQNEPSSTSKKCVAG